MTTIAARSLTIERDGQPIVEDLSLELDQAHITAIIGPNGCGKSTLLHGLCGLLPAASGQVLWEGKDLRQSPRKQLAKHKYTKSLKLYQLTYTKVQRTN